MCVWLKHKIKNIILSTNIYLNSKENIKKCK